MIIQKHIENLASLFRSGKIDYIRQGIQIWDTLCGDFDDFYKLLNAIAEDDIIYPDGIQCINQTTIERAFAFVPTSVSIRDTTVLWATSILAALSSTFNEQMTTLELKHIDFTILNINLGNFTNVTEAHWKNASLKKIPDNLLQLTKLQYLNLHQNDITTLPDWIGLLTLEVLSLSHNRLMNLPKGLAQLTTLKRLDLQKNYLHNIEPLKALSQLEYLNVEQNQLTELPPLLPSGLKEVRIAYNKFTRIPSICIQPGLKEFNCNQNPLTFLPEGIGQSETLETLNLSNTRLTRLPENLSHWTRLRSLTLQQTRLTTLPESIAHCKALEELYLNYTTSFKALPESIGALTNLHTLELCMNKVSRVPEGFERLTKLKKLYLYQAKLTEVPKALQHFGLLEELDLTYNKITHIPEWFYKLPSLTKVCIKGNNLDDVTIKRLLATFPDCDARRLIASQPNVFDK